MGRNLHQNSGKNYTNFFKKLFRHTRESISVNWVLQCLGLQWCPQHCPFLASWHLDSPRYHSPWRHHLLLTLHSLLLSQHSGLPVSWQSSRFSCTFSAHPRCRFMLKHLLPIAPGLSAHVLGSLGGPAHRLLEKPCPNVCF